MGLKILCRWLSLRNRERKAVKTGEAAQKRVTSNQLPGIRHEVGAVPLNLLLGRRGENISDLILDHLCTELELFQEHFPKFVFYLNLMVWLNEFEYAEKRCLRLLEYVQYTYFLG